MQHAFRIEGSAYRLRPAELPDCAFIVSIRTDPDLGKYLGDSAQSLEQQTGWMRTYFSRELDYYFIVERVSDGRPEGTVGLYDISTAANTPRAAEWGRWILRRGSWAALESAYLVYRFAFDVLSLDEVYCRTVAQNVPVISFHGSCGLGSGDLLPRHFTLRGNPVDAIEHRLKANDWPSIENVLGPKVAKIAHRLGQVAAGGVA